MKRIPRPLALTALALTAAGLAGCSEFSEQTTANQYVPADGSQLDLEDGVSVRNAMFLSDGGDAPGTLLATIVNDTGEDTTVSITGDGIGGEFDIDAGQVLRIGPEADEQLFVDEMGARPGELVTVEVVTPGAGDQLRIPVLDGTQSEYEDLVPTATPTATPTTTSATVPTTTPTTTSTTVPTTVPTTTATP